MTWVAIRASHEERSAAWAITREHCDWPERPCKPGKSECGPCSLVDKIVAHVARVERETLLFALGQLSDAERALRGWAAPSGGMGANITLEARGRTAAGLRAFDKLRVLAEGGR